MADSANIVDLILAKPLESLPYEEKLRIKQQGRSTPKIDLVQKIGKSNRSFQLSWYDLWRFSTAWYGTVRHGSVRYGTAQFGSVCISTAV